MAASISFRWPPQFTSDGDLRTVEDADEYRQRLVFQSLTTKTEMLYTEDGSTLKADLFEPNDEETRSLATAAVKAMFRDRAPDLLLLKVTFSYDERVGDDPTVPQHFVRVTVFYRSNTTGKEGTVAFTVPA